MPASPALTERHRLFETLYIPALTGIFNLLYRRLGAEAREDAVEDGLAMAWQTVATAAEGLLWQGGETRLGMITPATLASFIARAHRSGRRAAGGRAGDVMDPQCSLRHGSTVRTFSAVEAEAADGDKDLPAALLSRAMNSPVEQTRRHIDWTIIARRCRGKARHVLVMLAKGYRGIEIAARLDCSPSYVCQLKSRIAAVVQDLGYAPAA